MADGVKISEFTEIKELQAGCCFPTISDGQNRRITYEALKNQLMNEIKDWLFPVGSVLYNTSEINPETYIGGTWEKRYVKYEHNIGGLTNEYYRSKLDSSNSIYTYTGQTYVAWLRTA